MNSSKKFGHVIQNFFRIFFQKWDNFPLFITPVLNRVKNACQQAAKKWRHVMGNVSKIF